MVTVKQLIQRLERLDQNLEVDLFHDGLNNITTLEVILLSTERELETEEIFSSEESC